MTFSSTCDIFTNITRGALKAAKRHLVYKYNPCETIITITTIFSVSKQFLPFLGSLFATQNYLDFN